MKNNHENQVFHTGIFQELREGKKSLRSAWTILAILAALVIAGCSNGSPTESGTENLSQIGGDLSSSSSSDGEGATQAVVRLGMQALFQSGALSRAPSGPRSPAASARISEAMQLFDCSEAQEDSPGVLYGLDCDQDGGVATYITPERFRGAFRNVYLYNESGDTLQILPQTDSLVQSSLVDMTEYILIGEVESPRVRYTRIHVEVYYFDLKMELNHSGEMQWVRIYMSDDDFTAEGSLGHHQGDVVMLQNGETELGWAQGCTPWDAEHVDSERSEAHSGAGGTDPETGHERGFFGGENFWNLAYLMQGADQDVYWEEANLTVDLTESGAQNVLMVFDVVDAWFFEDFDANGVFSPGGANLEMCDETSAWAPLLPVPQFVVSDGEE